MKFFPLLNRFSRKVGSLRILFVIQLFIFLALFILPFYGPLQKLWFNQYHLTSSNFSVWSTLQVVPRMYNFENEYWYCPNESSLKSDINRENCSHSYLNHYPLRVITSGKTVRYRLSSDGNARYIFVSRYRGSVLRTDCKISRGKGDKIEVTCERHKANTDSRGFPE